MSSSKKSSTRLKATRLARCLVVEDNPDVADVVARLLNGLADTVVAHTVDEALVALAGTETFAGLVCDVALPDGSGLEVAERFRAEYPNAPILVVTALFERTLINRATELDADFVCKPHIVGPAQRFGERLASAASTPGGGPISSRGLARRYAKRFGLSPRETEILVEAVAGMPRAQLADHFGVSESTIKSQVGSLLRKTRHNRLAGVVWAVRKSGRGGTPTSQAG